MKALVAGAVGAFLLAGCLAVQETPVQETPVAIAANCPVIDSRGWTAHVNRMPGPGSTPTLHVLGEIHLPTPGYGVALRAGRADRSAIPVQQLVLELTPPTGMVAQVVTPQTARYEGPAIAARYRGIHIVCAGKVIAEIADVPDVR